MGLILCMGLNSVILGIVEYTLASHKRSPSLPPSLPTIWWIRPGDPTEYTIHI